MILAGIDVGTNAIRLLIAEISETSFRTIASARTITRLGKDLARTGRLSPGSRERSLAVLQEFAAIIRAHSVRHLRAVGTSALRNAADSPEFLESVERQAGFPIAIISGREEARLTLLGVRRALSGASAAFDPLDSALVVDIGGGSTELVATRDGQVVSDASIDLGAVYLTERFLHHDPPLVGELASLRQAVRQALVIWEGQNLRPLGYSAADSGVLAGTAGTATTLAAIAQNLVRYDPSRINGYRLARTTLDRIVERLAGIPRRVRSAVPGLEPGREDIIIAGGAILQEIADLSKREDVLVSDWGVREGIVIDLYDKSLGERY